MLGFENFVRDLLCFTVFIIEFVCACVILRSAVYSNTCLKILFEICVVIVFIIEFVRVLFESLLFIVTRV